MTNRIAAVLSLLLPGVAHAATLYSDSNDCEVQFTTSSPPFAITDLQTSNLLVGTAGSVGKERCPVLPFQLPDLGTVTNPFVTAAFTFDYKDKNGTVLGNMDIYGLGSRAGPRVLTNDYWTATGALDPTDATLLADDIITANSSAFGRKSTTDSAALVDFLNEQYAAGAGAGQYVFLRLSTDAPQTGGANRYLLTAAEGAAGELAIWPQIQYTTVNDPPDPFARPSIWVRNAEKAAILAKIERFAWAQVVYDGLVARAAPGVAGHQSDRDAFLRELPIDWTESPPVFKTIGPYSESSVRGPAESKFNLGVDCAVLYYLTGDPDYARCAADILHQAIQGLIPLSPSTSTGNGGWIWRSDFLKEARVTGTQLPIIYDFLHGYLQSNQVYEVNTGGMVDFDFADGQTVFRTLYQLARDHGNAGSNWSALMSTCMLNSLLALDDGAERAAALQVYLVDGSNRQASLDYDYRYYVKPGDIWPESLQYASGVGQIRSTHMVLLERYDPELNLFDTYPNLPLSLSRISYLQYPNHQQISFGDGHRDTGGQPFFAYELVYEHARARGRTELTDLYGSLINGGVEAGEYDRSKLAGYSSLGMHNAPLQLLWFAPSIPEPGTPLVLPRTDTLPFAGIALQRNPAPNNTDYGLMGFVGGAAHVHSHASGMSMELYGMGQVMGAKAGRDGYGSTLHEKYYRLFAANNTIIVNGASRGDGGWQGLGINTVKIVAMEPAAFEAAVSSNVSFTCSSFEDSKGTLAEGTQQRTLAIIRTSPTSGYYMDIFRSKSTVTNRVATTLHGAVTNQFHDYLYRNIGDSTVDIKANGVTLPLFSQPDRFQHDIGDGYEQPGWRYFDNTVVSYPHRHSVRAQFVADPSGPPIYMDMHMPTVAGHEVARVDSPPIVDAPSPYGNSPSPTLVVRQIGEAWDKPFTVVFEPHFSADGGTVHDVTTLLESNVVVGVKVESIVDRQRLTHYVISNPNTNQTYTDAGLGLSFTGRFAVITENNGHPSELYVGEGSALFYRGYGVVSADGSDTQASVLIAPGQAPVVTANAPVHVTVPTVSAPSFTRIEHLDGGVISITATGVANSAFTLWSSPGIAGGTWNAVTNGTVNASPFDVRDADENNAPIRYYRFSAP